MTLHLKKKKKIINIFNLKKNLATKMKLYTTSEFISNDISFTSKSIYCLEYYKRILYYNSSQELFNRLIASLLFILNT